MTNTNTLDRRALILNSLLAYLFGAAITILLHEMVHWLTGAALGYRSTMYAYGVTHHPAELPPLVTAATSFSAVLGSIVIGGVMAAWRPRERRGGFAHLLWLWVGFTSILEGVTYLIITPMGVGDTAVTAAALELPMWVQLLICAVGVAGMFGTARLFAPHLDRIAGADRPARLAATIWPWLLAIPFLVAQTVSSFFIQTMPIGPEVMIVMVMAMLAIGTFAPMSMMFPKVTAPDRTPMGNLRPWPIAGIVGYVAVLILHFVIRNGVSIGG